MRSASKKTVWSVFTSAIVFNFVCVIPAQSNDAWGALVSCCYKTPCQNVGTGFGSGPNEAIAVSRATFSAMLQATPSPDWKCTTVRAFSSGSGFIIGGSGAGNSVGYAIGATPQEATAKLSDQGLTPDGTGGSWGCVGP